MVVEKSPLRWANDLNLLLNSVHPEGDRFNFDMERFLLDYSKQRFPDDPILGVVGENLPDFEGGLFKKKKGWVVVYNNQRSVGRQRFTIAHEFGHYLLHRRKYPSGLQCGEDDLGALQSEYQKIEVEANKFAASFLMPLDDYRLQVDSKKVVTFEVISNCSTRYNVSLIASIIRWLSYTERRAILVVSREGYILWASSSDRAYRTGAYFRTVGGPPIEVPVQSLVTEKLAAKNILTHGKGVWFDEPCVEEVIISDQYDFSISLLHLEDKETVLDEKEVSEDALDHFKRFSDREMFE